MELTEFNEVLTSNDLIVCKLGASWCGPCKTVAPIIDELEQEYPNVKFLKLDVDECPDICTQLRVRNVPTVILFRNGEAVNKVVGGNKKETYVDAINNLING